MSTCTVQAIAITRTPITTRRAPHGYFYNGSQCEQNLFNKLVDKVVFVVGGEVVCLFTVGGVGARAADLIVKGGKKLHKWATANAIEEFWLEGPCDVLWDRYVASLEPPDAVEPECLSGTFVSGSCQPRDETDTEGESPPATAEPADGDSDDQQGGGSGDESSEIQPPAVTTTPTLAVGSVTGLGGSADGNSVWLGWNAPASGPSPTAYRVLRTASGGAEQEVAQVGGNAYFDRSLQSGVTYTYRIQAVSGTLAGPISASVSVTIP